MTLRTRILNLAAAALAAAVLGVASPAWPQEPGASDWGYWGGDAFGQHYSKLQQIDRRNVAALRVAWTYRTGELGRGLARADRLAFGATPVLAFGMLYLPTPTNVIIALDPETGHERWRFDPRIDRGADYADVTARGVAAWSDPEAGHAGPCQRRIFEGTLDAHLLAVDALTGLPCAGFGSGGSVDLAATQSAASRRGYLVTAPPALYRDLVIVGTAVGDQRSGNAARGVIRAFDARTGAPRWSFDPLPANDSHPAAGDWQLEQALSAGAGNASGAMSVDPGRGAVFVPIGSASPGAFGGQRLGSNRLANSLLALDAATGRLLWDQQLIHHDLWNFDLAAQPVLADLELDGTSWTAVIQATKSGMLYVFDRQSGAAVFPVTERSVPASRVPGEVAALTQPFSALPALVSPAPAKPTEAWGLTFWDRGRCAARITALRNEGVFTPPDTRGTLLDPGDAGGVDWGGMAFDPLRQRVIAAVNHMPYVVTLLERTEWERQLKEKAAGRGYAHAAFSPQPGTPYGVRREPLLSPFGAPCTPPPWGTLANVDLKTRRIVWQVPLGSTEGIAPWWLPVRDFGLPNAGGPLVTAGELVFIGAAADSYVRAFDVETGREIWKYRLPAGGQATPMTYLAGREPRQFLVIAAGGDGALATPRGDWIVAFALPPTHAPAR